MSFEEFKHSLSQSLPPANLSDLLTSLWYDGKGDWSKAHHMVQDLGSKDAAWIHAYLHRKEGDLGNAAYWYRRANRTLPTISLEMEWSTIVKELLTHS